MRQWAEAMALGIPEELYWRSTPQELGALVAARKKVEQIKERAACLRAGLVAAMIANVNRRKGAPLVKPEDFLKGERRHMTPEEGVAFMDRWATGINRRKEGTEKKA